MSDFHQVVQSHTKAKPFRAHPFAMRAIAIGVSIAFGTSATDLLAASQNWVVKNCNDSGQDSLREIVENPMNAKSGDSIDLSELPVRCGMMDSKITLGSEIKIAQDDLYLYGPLAGSVTISGAGASRVFLHMGLGVLLLSGLSITDGYLHDVGDLYGGCIESDAGDVTLKHVIVSNCVVKSESGFANGGGVSAFAGNVNLIASTVSHNEATTTSDTAWGGGIYSKRTTFAWYSSIVDNEATDGLGGGIATDAGLILIATTIANNSAYWGGGVMTSGSALIADSTISGNVASSIGGAIYARSSYITVANSTIAFNSATANDGGIHFNGISNMNELALQSSIIASNTSGAASSPSDIFIVPGGGSLAGADNLVMASNVNDPNVITLAVDPQLGPLRFNGGPTETHMPRAGSPLLGKGNASALPASITTDQRGAGYPRTTGAAAGIDIGAVQFDVIFTDNFNWAF